MWFTLKCDQANYGGLFLLLSTHWNTLLAIWNIHIIYHYLDLNMPICRNFATLSFEAFGGFSCYWYLLAYICSSLQLRVNSVPSIVTSYIGYFNILSVLAVWSCSVVNLYCFISCCISVWTIVCRTACRVQPYPLKCYFLIWYRHQSTTFWLIYKSMFSVVFLGSFIFI